MNDNRAPSNSLAKWICGAIVIVATAALAALLVLLFTKTSAFAAPRTGDLLIRALISSLGVSGVGGFVMLGLTKRAWWLFGPLLASASIALLLALGKAMGPAMH